jgi:hypothetical protein
VWWEICCGILRIHRSHTILVGKMGARHARATFFNDLVMDCSAWQNSLPTRAASNTASNNPKIVPLYFCRFGCKPTLVKDADLYKQARPCGTAGLWPDYLALRLPSTARTSCWSLRRQHRLALMHLHCPSRPCHYHGRCAAAGTSYADVLSSRRTLLRTTGRMRASNRASPSTAADGRTLSLIPETIGGERGRKETSCHFHQQHQGTQNTVQEVKTPHQTGQHNNRGLLGNGFCECMNEDPLNFLQNLHERGYHDVLRVAARQLPHQESKHCSIIQEDLFMLYRRCVGRSLHAKIASDNDDASVIP